MASSTTRSPVAATDSGSGGRNSAPPPPSSPLPSATSTAKISSCRTAQIARHFSTSSSPTGPVSKQQPDMASNYTVRKVAAPNTLEHRVYIEKDGQPVSPFHDIPLYANQEQTILNMVVEIPRWTNAKLEVCFPASIAAISCLVFSSQRLLRFINSCRVPQHYPSPSWRNHRLDQQQNKISVDADKIPLQISKEELLNPIKQDIKKGKLRYVRNCFPHKGYLWNYGAFPQTWEDPNTVHPETKAKGDNDPLDVCEIGELVGYPGQIKQVKVLGVMALLDEEETDWKVIVIDVNDPLASKLNDVEDVERHLPGLLRATNEWFRIYKIPDGKPENQFAFTGECKNKDYALDVVRECAEAWERLVTGKTPAGGVSTTNVTVQHSPSRVSPDQLPPLPANEELPAEKIDASIDKWFFISGASA
jgi:inorganic pyrophosphatase